MTVLWFASWGTGFFSRRIPSFHGEFEEAIRTTASWNKNSAQFDPLVQHESTETTRAQHLAGYGIRFLHQKFDRQSHPIVSSLCIEKANQVQKTVSSQVWQIDTKKHQRLPPCPMPWYCQSPPPKSLTSPTADPSIASWGAKPGDGRVTRELIRRTALLLSHFSPFLASLSPGFSFPSGFSCCCVHHCLFHFWDCHCPFPSLWILTPASVSFFAFSCLALAFVFSSFVWSSPTIPVLAPTSPIVLASAFGNLPAVLLRLKQLAPADVSPKTGPSASGPRLLPYELPRISRPESPRAAPTVHLSARLKRQRDGAVLSCLCCCSGGTAWSRGWSNLSTSPVPSCGPHRSKPASDPPASSGLCPASLPSAFGEVPASLSWRTRAWWAWAGVSWGRLLLNPLLLLRAFLLFLLLFLLLSFEQLHQCLCLSVVFLFLSLLSSSCPPGTLHRLSCQCSGGKSAHLLHRV